MDVLLVELCKIVLWFNPIIYFYKKSLIEIHEFEADLNTVQQFDSKNYAHLLLKLGISRQVDLTNQFSLHPLSTRIQFLFKKRTITAKKLFYMLGLPILALGIFAFAQRNEKLIYEVTKKASEKVNSKIASLSEAIKSIKKDSIGKQQEIKPLISVTPIDSSKFKLITNPFLLKTPEVQFPDYTKNPMRGGEVTITTRSKNTPEYYSLDFFKDGKYITKGVSADSIKIFQEGRELVEKEDFEFVYEKGIITKVVFKEHVRSETVGIVFQMKKYRPYTALKENDILLHGSLKPTLNSPWRYKVNLAAQQNFNTDTLRTYLPANFLGKEPLVIINGREYHPRILQSLNYREGRSYVAKPNDPKAIEKYGLKAEDGVVDLKTTSSFEFDSERKRQVALENVRRELSAYQLYKNDKIVKVRLFDDEGNEFERVIIKVFSTDRSVSLNIPINGKIEYKVDGKAVSEFDIINYKDIFYSNSMWQRDGPDSNGNSAGIDLRTKQ